MKRLVVISDFLPCPPNNGVALPIFNLLKRLRGRYKILYLYVDGGAAGRASQAQIAENRNFIDVQMVTARARSKKVRIGGELRLRAPYFHRLDPRSIDVSSQVGSGDILLFTPFTALTVADAFAASRPAGRVAWINDSATAMMRSRLKNIAKPDLGVKKRLHLLSQWLRGLYMGRIEARCLEPMDLVYVQTHTERDWLLRISKGRLRERIRVVTNGVNDDLFKLPIQHHARTVLFFGNLSGIYADLARWLILHVWPRVRDVGSEVRLRIVGAGASEELLALMRRDSHIDYLPYISEIEDVFAGQGVMLAPVFKDYGVINKVLESMAAGIPVIGDRSAYHGIPGFVAGNHGIVANTAKTMAEEATGLLGDRERYVAIAHAARQLMRSGFSWDSRVSAVENDLEGLFGRQT